MVSWRSTISLCLFSLIIYVWLIRDSFTVTIAGSDGRLVIATLDGKALHTSRPKQREKEGVTTIHQSKNDLSQGEREGERERERERKCKY